MIRFILFILFFAFVYFLFKLFFQILLPFINHSRKYKSQYHQNYSGNKKKEGDITIENIPKKEKMYKKNDGEYVDFKEV